MVHPLRKPEGKSFSSHQQAAYPNCKVEQKIIDKTDAPNRDETLKSLRFSIHEAFCCD